MRPLRVLALHGYWFGPDSWWAEWFNELVCAFVFSIHTNYDSVLLLSGWGGKGRKETIAELHRKILIRLGVPKKKLKTQKDFGIYRRPPLDTWEEVMLLKKMLLALGSSDAKVDVVTMHWHATRTYIVYWGLGVRSGEFFRVDGPLTVMRFIHEVAGFLIALIHRDGQGPLLRYERLKRLKEMRHR